MNGYLTKPFTEKSLYAVIIKVLNNAKRIPCFNNQTFNFDAQTLESMNHEKPYNLNTLESMSGGDPSFLPMMAKLFVDTIPPILEKMEQSFQAKDWKSVGAFAHKLKPTIDAMNINGLLETVRQIELQGKQEMEVETIEGKIGLMRNTLDLCITRLKEEFSI